MDTDPKFERIDSKPNAGNSLPKPTKKRIETLLKQGMPAAETSKLVAVDAGTVKDIQNNLADSGQLDVLAFKRRTAMRLASFIDKGLARLDDEVQDMPIGQLPLATAIALDKLVGLVDQTPVVNIKAELRISAEDINKLLDVNSLVIDVTPPEKKL
jgi:hypothetical protein